MSYKIVCTDIDGTLLNKDRRLSDKTIQEITRIKETVPVILISSRMPKSMKILQEQLGILNLPIIAYNGSLILDNDEVLQSIELPHSQLLAINSYCKGTDIHLSLYHNNEWVVPEMDYWANREANNTQVNPTVKDFDAIANIWEKENKGCHKIMCMGDEAEIGVLYEKLVKFHSEDLNIYRSKPTYIEISDKKQDKASALETLLNKRFPEYTMADVIAFGDNYNDLSLLTSVGLGVAVENAKTEVLNQADEVTKSNINDGVALTLCKYF